MRGAGLLGLWMPELAACVGVPQNRFHAYDVYVHSLATCDAAPRERPRVRWAALLHDIGKPSCRAQREGAEATFYGHDQVGAEMADRRLEALRFPRAEREAITHLIREHMFDFRPEWTDAALRRWLRRVTPEAMDDLFLLRAADVEGSGLSSGPHAGLLEMRRRIERLLAEDDALRISQLAVDGRDVMRVLGIEPGERVGRVLAKLLEEVLEDPAKNDHDALLRRLAEWRGETGEGSERGTVP
jgi:poly(A) polymerase/tRNA nucleotidyltransferase (CCA-adding enzyme)